MLKIQLIDSNTCISPQDRGLLYGDGFFTTCRIARHQPVCWPSHRQRIKKSAQQLKFPELDLTSIEQALTNLPESGIVKIVITRGCGPRGYAIPETTKPQCFIDVSPLPPSVLPNQLQYFNVTLCDTPISINPSLAGIKHLNRLDLVLARGELKGSEFQEGLLQSHGILYCATQANLYFVKQGVITTPLLDKAGVKGVMRTQIKQWAKEMNYRFLESEISVNQIGEFDECFLSIVCVVLLGLIVLVMLTLITSALPGSFINVFYLCYKPGLHKILLLHYTYFQIKLVYEINLIGM